MLLWRWKEEMTMQDLFHLLDNICFFPQLLILRIHIKFNFFLLLCIETLHWVVVVTADDTIPKIWNDIFWSRIKNHKLLLALLHLKKGWISFFVHFKSDSFGHKNSIAEKVEKRVWEILDFSILIVTNSLQEGQWVNQSHWSQMLFAFDFWFHSWIVRLC